jgi:predicted RNase H-like HicB family nuclease
MARDGDRPLGGGAAPDVVPRAAPNALATLFEQMLLEVTTRRHRGSIPATAPRSTLCVVELHVVFEPDEEGWVRATIEELPGVITCAPTLDEARERVRDALDEWLQSLTSAERATMGADGTRETLTLSVA